MRKKHFTLIEIMIVVAIIALLALIALPNFMKARENARESTCIANLKQVAGAKQQWALEEGKGVTDVPAMAADLADYFSTDVASIYCPIGKKAYTPTAVSAKDVCPNVATYTTHVLP